MVAFLSFSFYPSQTETLRTCDSPSTSLFFRSLQLIFIDRPILPSAGHKLKPIGVFHFRTRTNSVSLPLRCWRKSPVTLPPCGDKPTHKMLITFLANHSSGHTHTPGRSCTCVRNWPRNWHTVRVPTGTRYRGQRRLTDRFGISGPEYHF